MDRHRTQQSPKPWAKLYGRAWRKARREFLQLHPICECFNCAAGEKPGFKLADTVDHKRPHRGDVVLFWDRNNWQALARQCHDSWKQALEKSGRMAGTRVDGTPVDPNHPWNLEAVAA